MYFRIEAVIWVFILGAGATTATPAEPGSGTSKASREEAEIGKKTKGAVGFFQRAFEEAKRIGAAIDPDTVAEVEKTWNDIRDASPELRQAADELLQAKDELLNLRKEAGDVWSGIQRSGLTADGLEGQQEIEPEFGSLARDVAAAATGIVGEVLGDIRSEIASSLESRLTEALSEGNLREASLMWRRLLDTPGVMLIARDRKLWAGAERAVRNYLQSYMSEESAIKAERAMNAIASYALHFAGLTRNANKADHEVFDELSSKMCHLQGATEKLWPAASRVLPLVGYGEYISSVEKALRAHAVSRMTLTVTAGALLGLNPRNDPFLMTLIASFSLGHLTKDVATNLAAFFQKALVETSPSFNRGFGGPRQGNAVDLVGELLSGTNTCHDMGHQAFEFFQVVKRAISPSSESSEKTRAEMVNDFLTTSSIARSSLKLGIDGWVLRATLWMAIVVDLCPASPRVLFAGLCTGFALFLLVLWRPRRRRRANEKEKKR